MALNAGTGQIGGSSYGDLSKHDAFTIQKKMLPIAKRLLTFGKFAQKETKPQKEGLEIRHRRYERFPIVDSPIAEGVTPNFVNLQHTTIKHVLQQYGSYVNTTDIMLAASTDPVVNIITERQAQQAGETIDFLTYKEFRAGTQVGYARSSVGSGRADVDYTIANTNSAVGAPAATTTLLDRAIRVLENNDASKLKEQLDATDGVTTSPIRESFVAVGHVDLRQDLEQIPGYVPVEKYADQSDVMDGEVGSARGIRFILTTQAMPFKSAGASVGSTGLKSTNNSNIDVYPILIMAQDFGGCATLGGKDSLRSKIVLPKPGPGDPLGQRGTVAWDTTYSCIILQDLYLYRIEVGVSHI
ncbi:MAG: N4-gp56 family major capsid protein [Acidimicrobiaceae bacterium]|nr:N4-gp56 family major capsid protein [Acidimicrobiaceae bacterium]